MTTDPAVLRQIVEASIQSRTNRRIRYLDIDIRPQLIVVRGSASSYYLKQLAQHGIREILPETPLHNAIEVESRPV